MPKGTRRLKPNDTLVAINDTDKRRAVDVILTDRWDSAPEYIDHGTGVIGERTAEGDVVGVRMRQDGVGGFTGSVEHGHSGEELARGGRDGGNGSNHASDGTQVVATKDATQGRA